MDFIEITGKTIEEAVNKGCIELGKSQDEVEITVLEQPSNGFLGFGKKDARVRLTIKEVKITVDDIFSESAEVEKKEVSAIELKNEENKKVTEIVITTEEKAVIAERGRTFLYDVFEKMGLSVMIEKMISEDKITFQVHGENLGILIGKHGQTLDSIQYLTNLVANKQVPHRCHVVVDIENYRARREETLIQLARRLGEKVKKERRRIVLEPMNSYERKVIHLALQNAAHIRTDSEGEGNYRHVVISYVK